MALTSTRRKGEAKTYSCVCTQDLKLNFHRFWLHSFIHSLSLPLADVSLPSSETNERRIFTFAFHASLSLSPSHRHFY